MRCGPSVMWAVSQRATTSAMPPIQLAHQSPQHISMWKVHHLTLASFTLKTHTNNCEAFLVLIFVPFMSYWCVFSCHNVFLIHTIANCTRKTFKFIYRIGVELDTAMILLYYANIRNCLFLCWRCILCMEMLFALCKKVFDVLVKFICFGEIHMFWCLILSILDTIHTIYTSISIIHTDIW